MQISLEAIRIVAATSAEPLCKRLEIGDAVRTTLSHLEPTFGDPPLGEAGSAILDAIHWLTATKTIADAVLSDLLMLIRQEPTASHAVKIAFLAAISDHCDFASNSMVMNAWSQLVSAILGHPPHAA